MKKLVTSLLMLSVLILSAQDTGFGIRGGLNHTTSSIPEIFGLKDSLPASKASGFSGTFFLDFGVTKAFSIETSFQFNQNETDSQVERLPSGDIKKTGVVSDYYEIPVLGKLRFGSQLLKINVFAGPNFSFEQKRFVEERLIISESDPEIVRTDIPKENFESYSYRNLAGFGASIHLNGYSIFADYRYHFKFKDLDNIRQNGLFENLGSNVGVGLAYYW